MPPLPHVYHPAHSLPSIRYLLSLLASQGRKDLSIGTGFRNHRQVVQLDVRIPDLGALIWSTRPATHSCTGRAWPPSYMLCLLAPPQPPQIPRY